MSPEPWRSNRLRPFVPSRPKTLRTRGNAVLVYGKTCCVLGFDCPAHTTTIERRGHERGGRRKKDEGDQVRPLTLARSVAPHRWVDLETPAVDSADEVAHFPEPLVPKPVHGSLATCSMVTINDHLDVPVERVYRLRQ